jgi:hypothetical protein
MFITLQSATVHQESNICTNLTPVEALHDKLVGTRDECEAVGVVKLLCYILPECIPSSTRWYTPPTPVIWVRPQKVTHWTLMRYLHKINIDKKYIYLGRIFITSSLPVKQCKWWISQTTMRYNQSNSYGPGNNSNFYRTWYVNPNERPFTWIALIWTNYCSKANFKVLTKNTTRPIFVFKTRNTLVKEHSTKYYLPTINYQIQ